ncbi:type II secretion system F family protein [Nocardiopsis sp. CT-R113]|uniref:Type II secretion system F family protein n=1 Tax=Nocardiopsis codii TaxID=3065942 RepID=A0ABU7KC17_9ACTN|nr:type II secretion system F family protein [Nocardiopsis sp. CT-R113]MEE2039773.1 type II secretion system F family protein [Nocardiopsis sp. CT-R113]
MLTVTAVLFGAAAAWVSTGGGRVLRTRLPGTGGDGGPSHRSGLPFRALALTLGGVSAVAAAATLFGPVGGVLAVGGCTALWVRARRAGHRPERLPVTSDLPVVIGLLSSGIRAGATLPVCLTAVSGAARGRLGDELGAVADQLRLGADPVSAWRRSALPAPLAAVGRDLARAADTGAPVADLLDRHATDLRRTLHTRATARVERLGVLVVAPLGLCFLPAFVLIGIVPMAAELLSRALGT